MRPDLKTLTFFFKPAGVAVIGASADPAKIGHGVMKNLVDAQFGFRGPIYPVNPKAEEVLGRKCYRSVLEVPDPVDLAVIVIPAAAAVMALKECGQRGVKAAVILSGGFREAGGEGIERERQCVEIAAKYGMRLMGPNCIGVMDTHTPLNTTFVPGMTRPGVIDFVSQSGALCGGIIDWAQARGLKFSRFLSIGNKADVNESDLLAYLAGDEVSRVLTIYVEDIKDGPGFVTAARQASASKPTLILKSGRTASGQAATASHTGALAGAQSAFRAVARQTGLMEVDEVETLFNAALALATQPLPAGRRIAVLTNSGGPAALAADAMEPAGLSLPATSAEVRAALRTFLPAEAGVGGPVDMLGGADEGQFRRALEVLLDDPGNDGVLLIVVPTLLNKPQAIVENMVSLLDERKPAKPVLACLFGEASLGGAYAAADRGGLPAYRFPEDAVKAFGYMQLRAAWLAVAHPPAVRLGDVGVEAARGLLEEARKAGASALSSETGRDVLAAYGIATPLDKLARSPEEAVEFAAGMGCPVALKISSPDILHKTEVGGVALNVADAEGVRANWQAMMSRARAAHPGAELRGVQVQQMVRGGLEVIVGVKRDPVFGPLVMFGLGGIHVEVLGDVSFRLAPLARQDAEAMIAEVRSAKLLAGVRGAAPSDTEALIDVLLRVGQLAADHPEIEEMDINPLMVMASGQGALAVDWRILLGTKGGG